MVNTHAMPRENYVNIKITLNRNQNTPSGFLGATHRASITPKDEISVVEVILVMKWTHQTYFSEERQFSEKTVNESFRSTENYSQELVSETWKFLFST
jgi:hypothetical protein